MLGSLLFMLAMTWMLLLGCASAGEESIMAMRGETPDGRAQVNQFQYRVAGTDVPAESVQGSDYLEWKDICVRTPVMVAGQVVEVGAAGSFCLVQPYALPPAQAIEPAGGFFDALLQELALEESEPSP